MCGIFLSVGYGVDAPKPNDTLCERLNQRGPDAHTCRENKLKIPGHPWISTRIEGSVLSLRGAEVVGQPIQGDDVREQPGEACGADFFMCWNGEAWTLDDQAVKGSDTTAVFKLIVQVLCMVSRRKRARYSEYHVLDVLARVRGPYAFVFLDEYSNKIYFARDCLGRRSLLFKCDSQSLVLSSVGDGQRGWTEVECNRLYVLDYNPQMSLARSPNAVTTLSPQDAVIATMRNSGLVFEISALHYPWSDTLFKLNDSLPSSVVPPLTTNSMSVTALEEALRHSLHLRLALPRLSHHDAKGEVNPTLIAILFSGGVDCTLLARIANDILPPSETIDLLNVAFQNPRIHGHETPTGDTLIYEACPDRITARQSLDELRRACPNRPWQFVEINVPYSEVQAHRSTVTSLLAPHNTEMDLSIGLALYFAARGNGIVNGREYSTQSRILLSGLGADELFGGYQRHATAFRRGGFRALMSELALDTARLGKRNLGRDDRIIAHWGREVRYPHLDEALVEFAAKATLWEKCGFGTGAIDFSPENNIEPGKLVLRLLADKLGLPGVAREKKRAIQFGARTAKMDKGRTRGSNAIE